MAHTEIEVIELLKKHTEKPSQWVVDARKQNTELKALITGEGFHNELINHIEHLESSERAGVRRKYSKDIRDLSDRLYRKYQNVYDANGGSENNDISSDTIKEEFIKRLTHFKSNKSLFSYLEESYMDLKQIDPNGLIMLEYRQRNEEFETYPSYKSIHDVRYYHQDGQLVDFLLFEPVVNEKLSIKTWRFVDSETDYTFNEVGGEFFIDEDKTFNHPFGDVPAIILSEMCVVGSNVRLSLVNSVKELMKDYARDKSILTIYKFQNGIPLHWRYGSFTCKPCSGTGKLGNNACHHCDGRGHPKKSDVSDMYMIPIPKEGQPFLGDKIAGFTSPDLETWKQYKIDLKDAELLMDDTIWGTDKVREGQSSNETATGRRIDLQPVRNALNKESNVVEYVYNTFAGWILNFVDLTKERDEKQYHRTMGRNYIIESDDVLTERYGTSKKNGDNNTILDKQLEEVVLSRYKSDPIMQSRMIKKIRVEPYIHLSTKEVFDYYGAVESNKKVLFTKFWQQADKDKTEEVLITEFDTYFKKNNTIEDVKTTSFT